MNDTDETISQREVEIIFAQMQLLGIEDNLYEMRRALQTRRRVVRELKKVPGFNPPVLREFFRELMNRDARFLDQVHSMRAALTKAHMLLSHGRKESMPPEKAA